MKYGYFFSCSGSDSSNLHYVSCIYYFSLFCFVNLKHQNLASRKLRSYIDMNILSKFLDSLKNSHEILRLPCEDCYEIF